MGQPVKMIQHVLLTAVSFAAERLGQRCFCSQLSSPAMFKVFVKSLMKDMQDDESNYQDVSSAGSVDVLGSAAAFGTFR